MVGHRLSGSNRALGDGRNTVVLAVVQLTETVEVDAGTVVLELVVHLYDNGVTPAGPDWRAGHLTIDCEHHARDTIGRKGNVGNVELVVHNSARLGSECVIVGGDVATAEFAPALVLTRDAVVKPALRGNRSSTADAAGRGRGRAVVAGRWPQAGAGSNHRGE